MDVKIDYYTEVAKLFKGFEGPLQSVNRNKIINPKYVITDPNQSAMNPKVSHPSPAQQQQQQIPQQQAQQIPQQRSAPQAQQQLPNRPPPQPQAAVVRAQALYVFQAQDNTELSFQPGEMITVIRQSGEWWEGEIGSRRGLFPANYVRVV